MNIRDIEELLRAKHIGSYVSGHMGSKILCFRRIADKSPLVVKFAPVDNTEAITDIEANIRGYTKIQALGGSPFVPPALKEISVKNGKALVMRDLGASMRIADGGLDECILLWKHFRYGVLKTIAQPLPRNERISLPPFVKEVLRHIERFSHGSVPNLLKVIRRSDWVAEWGRSAIMLLDFTPDNLFVNEEGLWFIDPWSQGTYLGHPAVSIGQFVTLMQLYRMRDADRAAYMLKERCMVEMPVMLGCDAFSVELAFRLGSTLQFVLSSYVRRKSNPSRASELVAEAHKLWQQKHKLKERLA